MKRTAGLLVAAISAAALVAGCSGSNASATDTITVFAAASLKPTFTELGRQMERANPDTTVRFSFAGSSDLATQLTQGAPADVFASADTANMTKVVDTGVVNGDPVAFATNTLTIVTPPANPKDVASFADLVNPDTSVVVCAAQVPCGSAAERIEQATGVQLNPVSEESSVTDVLGKVTSGQADAGLVYVTDANDAGDAVAEVPFPESADAPNTYPIAVLEDSANAQAAQKFVDLVTGPQAQKVLHDAGFSSP